MKKTSSSKKSRTNLKEKVKNQRKARAIELKKKEEEKKKLEDEEKNRAAEERKKRIEETKKKTEERNKKNEERRRKEEEKNKAEEEKKAQAEEEKKREVIKTESKEGAKRKSKIKDAKPIFHKQNTNSEKEKAAKEEISDNYNQFIEDKKVEIQEEINKQLMEVGVEEWIDDDYNFNPEIKELPKSNPDSPMLDKTTKDKLLHLGLSYDSKQLADALGFIDLRLLLRCFAKAVLKHITFSKGYLFHDDLKMMQSQQENLQFTYNLGKNMKIDLNKKDATKEEVEFSISKNKENFNKMKHLMENDADGSHTNKFSNPITIEDNEILEDLPDETIRPKRKNPFDYTIPEEVEKGKTLLTATDKFNSDVNR